MITVWMLYAAVLAVLFGAAALALERLLRLYGLQARWVWLVSLVSSLVVPVVAYWWTVSHPGDAAAVGIGAVAGLAGADPGALATSANPWIRFEAGPVLRALDGVLPVVWLAGSIGLLLLVLGSLAGLSRRRRTWRAASVDGQPVLVSRDVGPAVVGFLRRAVVLPEWALGFDDRLRRLMLVHEREHVRAGDSWLVLAGVAAVVLAPWNPAVWWQARRLRLALEVDCDARVLRGHPDVHAYGMLLLEVGRRVSGGRLVLAAFSESGSFLERRIRSMTSTMRTGRIAAAVALVAVGVVLIAMACQTPVPEAVLGPDAGSAARTEEAPERPAPSKDLTAGPFFTPHTMAPELSNRAEVQRALVRQYPPLLRDAGIGGQVLVWFLIDETGGVQKTQIKTSSGHEALDQAALRVAEVMEFRPAMNRDQRVPVWVALPITFGANGAAPARNDGDEAARRERLEVRARRLQQAAAAERSAADRPAGDARAFTPVTAQPRLKNQAEVQRALIRHYPPLLRDAGIGGTAQVWFFVDESGKVARYQLRESSGHEALDQAALQVADVLQFEPARNGDGVVSAWVALPISFSAK